MNNSQLILKRSLTTSIHNNVRGINIGGPVRDSKVIIYSFEKASPYMRNIVQPKVIDMKIGSMKMFLKYRKRFQGPVQEEQTQFTPSSPSSMAGDISPAFCLQNGIVATMMDHVTGACAWTCLPSSDLFVNTVDLEVQYLEPVPCEDLLFEATLVDIDAKLVVVNGVCWDRNKTTKLVIARGLFNIYKNPQPLLHSIFRFFVNTFGGPLFLGRINPVTLMHLLKQFQDLKSKFKNPDKE